MEALHPCDQRPSSTEVSPLRRNCQMQPARQALLEKKKKKRKNTDAATPGGVKTERHPSDILHCQCNPRYDCAKMTDRPGE